MFSFIIKGGPIMWPILLCSVIALAIFLEKVISLRKKKIIPLDFLTEIEGLVKKNKVSETLTLCRNNNSSIARVIAAGIANLTKPITLVKTTIEDRGRREASHLERYVGVLGIVASVAPLLGLLGTVAGMIQVFQVISLQGIGNAPSLAGGISQALITTAAGLIVAIPTLVAYKYCQAKVDGLVGEMEKYAIDIFELIKGDKE